MFISKFQVFNYKSYLDSGLIQFTPGINIIVGQNNAGKTSLLEALTLNFDNQPHLSLKTLPSTSSIIKEKSNIKIHLLIQKEKFYSFLEHIQSRIGIPEPVIFEEDEPYYKGNSTEAIKRRYELIIDTFNKFKNFLDTSEYVEIILPIFPEFKLETSTLEKLSTFGCYSPALANTNKKGKYDFYTIEYDDEKLIIATVPEGSYEDAFYSYEAQINESIGYKLFEFFAHKIYRFKAERLIIGSCRFENNPELKSDMSNLAEVLSILQGINPERFRRFNDYVSSVLPQIKGVSVRHQDDSIVEIMVWTIDPKSERDDLSFPLASCGTGVSQVLVILCILITSQEPRTIIIDEPQSFLHPGAAKKLIETLKQFPQHQYIIATHSPEIIASANPSTIIKLQYQDCKTTASVINTKEIESQNEILAELGVSLSDVFGADNILWVEGKTEEKCFPMILEKLLNRQLNGTKILAVQEVGDLEGTRAQIIFDIYKKLSEGTNLFPPAIGFLLDSENRSEEDKQVFRERSAKPVEFLSRRMYENYLIDSEAIAAVFNEDNQSRQEPLQNITSVDVEEWLKKKKLEEGLSEKEWLDTIDASNILKQLFSNFSCKKIKYKKLKHSYEITKWLVDNKPDLLLRLAKEVAKMLS